MDQVEEKIHSLMRDKLISLIQENAVRIKKVNIKYTTSNKKHSIEHWQAYYDSYEKLFRSLPKELVRVEKEVRAKFVSPLTPERKIRLLSFLNTEADLLFKKLEKECRDEFQKLGCGDQFEERLEISRNKFTENLEAQLQKCEEALESETTASGKLPIGELCRIFELNEGFLHELNLIDPLQKIQIHLNKAGPATELGKLIEGVKESLKRIAKNLQNQPAQSLGSVGERKGHKMVVARETMALRELVIHTNYMLEYAMVPDEMMNTELAKKLFQKLETFFDTGRNEWKPEFDSFKAVYQYTLAKGKRDG